MAAHGESSWWISRLWGCAGSIPPALLLCTRPRGGGSSLPDTVQASNAPVHRGLLAGGNGPTGSLSRLLFKKHCLDSSNSPGTHRLITAHF